MKLKWTFVEIINWLMDNTLLQENNVFYRNLHDKALELFGPTIRTQWNGQDSKKKDDLIDHMVNLLGNTFNKKVVTKLASENLKYTRAQYRDKLQIVLKHEPPPMVPEKEWTALIEDAKENLFKKQGLQPQDGQGRYNTCHIISQIWAFIFFFPSLSNNSYI